MTSFRFSRSPLTKLSLIRIVLLFGIHTAEAQADPEATFSLNLNATMEALSQTIAQEQQALDQAEQNLIDQNATDLQLEAWEQQHAGAFDAQDDRRLLLSAYGSFQPLELITSVSIPDAASDRMENFLVASAELLDGYADIHNSLAEAGSQTISVAAADQLEQTTTELFEQQYGAQFKAVAAQAKAVADEQVLQPLAVSPISPPPAGAGPALQAYLLASAQLTREQILVHDQNCSGTVAQLEAALEQWQDENASRFKQISLMAKALAPASETQDESL